MHEDTSTPAVLGAMRITLHVSFAALLLLGAGRAVLQAHASGTGVRPLVLLLGLAVLLAAVYLVGTVAENRAARRQAGWDPRPLALPWLMVVTVLWGTLTLLSSDFSWVVFPLFFVYLVLLPRAVAVGCIVVLTAVVIVAQFLHTGPEGFRAAMVVGPVVGAVFAVVVGHGYRRLYRDAQRHRRVIRELEAARTELAHREREAGRSAERERLSREIHDTLAQGLSSIVLMSRAARQSLAQDDPVRAGERMAIIEATAVENLAEARRFVRDLSSPALDSSLLTALREVCAHTEQRVRASGEDLDCKFRCEGEVPDLPSEYQSLLLRAAQSSLANVAAHSRARTAVVTLAGWDDAVSLDVFDDGIGFVPDAADRDTGEESYGLTKLQHRVRELGGTFALESEPGNGTVISIRLPLTRPTAAPTHRGAGNAVEENR
ncbi:sensor histidine kinase [Kocuria rosea]|uniref:sensor histidine kinase n=2 Tax=Kocuria rosea TaxID=1275 RepID=UPI002330E08B|nr:sensor histidine kinase [Kocuria rosea]